MNKNYEELLRCFPKEGSWEMDWESLEKTFFHSYIEKLAATEQNPFWHGEGDVWTHTKMVCTAICQDVEFQQLPEKKRQLVMMAALFHDLGKIPTTCLENEIWTSPKHTIIGEKMVRELLWKKLGLCGTKEKQSLRESICLMVRYHSIPSHILDQTNPERRLIQIASQIELVPDFSFHLLKILVRGDMKGRICEDKEVSLDKLDLCMSLVEEMDIMEKPYPFLSPSASHAYFSGKNIWLGQDLYDDTWGEVILMAGLPGTGKDTWIAQNYPDLPVISLDDIREKLDISPEQPQGEVVKEARQQAKELLRQKQPFIWNATNTTSMIRKKQVDLFEQYHASVRIIFLETSLETELERNRGRERQVPEKVIEKLLRNLEMPKREEAKRVQWICL